MTALPDIQKLITLRGTQAAITGLTAGLEESMLAYATDTGQLGIYTGGSWSWVSALDHKVAVSADDTTPNFLENKLAAGTNIVLTEINEAGNEAMSIATAPTVGVYAPMVTGDTPGPVLIDTGDGQCVMVQIV